MRYLLDTNACIAFLRKRQPQLVGRMQRIPLDDITVCSIVKAELRLGAIKGSDSSRSNEMLEKFLGFFESLPFDDKCTEAYARTRAALEREGLIIGANDLLISSIAIANDLTLVTSNTREFSRVPDLRHENWELP